MPKNSMVYRKRRRNQRKRNIAHANQKPPEKVNDERDIGKQKSVIKVPIWNKSPPLEIVDSGQEH